MESSNSSPELSLDLKPISIPTTITQFLRGVSRIGSVTEKVLQLDDFVNRLETEAVKIQAFKRELPLCMLLINDAIVAMKEESTVLKRSSNAEPVVAEFIPLKNTCDDDRRGEIMAKKDGGDKKNWLSSTQLWNTNENIGQKANASGQTIKKRGEEEDEGRAFCTPGIKNPMRPNGMLTEINGGSIMPPCSTPNVEAWPPQQQTSRKRRRCWSTELHRRFVSALQLLGGSQATPKQIRELMQVDGLTNDEVKSHLQKYRLHMRKLPSSNPNQSEVVLGGGLWPSFQDPYVGSSKSGSPDGPLRNGGNNMDEEDDDKSENYCWNGNL